MYNYSHYYHQCSTHYHRYSKCMRSCDNSINWLRHAGSFNPWTSSNTSRATVSSTGLVTGVSAGTVTITYLDNNGCSRTASVTINALPTITGTLSACIGATTQLTGSASPAATNPWTSSNTGIATVSSTGLVTGVSSGTVTITYQNNNGCSTTATVTIEFITDYHWYS